MLTGPGIGIWIPTLLVLALGALWGAHFSIIKIAVGSGLPIGSIIVGTASGAALALGVVCFLRRRMPPISLVHLRFYAVCAFLSYGLPFFLELTVAFYLTAGLLTLIITMDPVFTAAIAMLGKRELVSRKRILGLAISAFAVLMLLLPGVGLPAVELLGWVLLAFCVPASYACYHTYVASAWPVDLDSWQAGAGEVMASLLVFIPLALWQGDLEALTTTWSMGHWTILFMALSGVLEAYLYFEIVRRAGAVFVSQAGLITVITGMLWGMIIFGEQPGPWLWLSASCLLLGLYFTRSTEPLSQ